MIRVDFERIPLMDMYDGQVDNDSAGPCMLMHRITNDVWRHSFVLYMGVLCYLLTWELP